MPPPLRWGLAATGAISHDFVNALSTIDDLDSKHKVVAVAARSMESAMKFADKFGIKRAYEGYNKLAEDKEVEVVYVGTLHPQHLEVCKMLINAGKNVLCEKPLAMTLKQTEEMVSLAREKKVFLMEAMWSRFQPAHMKMKEEIKSGAIGNVVHVDANMQSPGDIQDNSSMRTGTAYNVKYF